MDVPKPSVGGANDDPTQSTLAGARHELVQPTPFDYICGLDKFEPRFDYEREVTWLLGELLVQASVGTTTTHEVVEVKVGDIGSAAAFCRPFLPRFVCTSCLRFAISTIAHSCTFSRVASFHSDDCWLRYHDS